MGHGSTSISAPPPGKEALEALIRAGAVDVVFQPIVDVVGVRVAGCEVLTRPHASSGFANPSVLFDCAAEHGLLWELERLTREKAFAAAAGWDADTLLFVNCSPQVFADERFADELVGALSRTAGLTAPRVVLEITERSEQSYVAGLAQQVARLKSAGFQIAIDDVGAGTSGLNRMMLLRPHWLKLDRELVRGLESDRVVRNLIRFLVHFARLSGVRIIAEGIERPGELEALVELGVGHVQGYLLSRPVARDQLNMREIASRVLSLLPVRREGGTLEERTELERLVRKVAECMPGEDAGGVADRMRQTMGAAGALIMVGDHAVGWCDRETLLAGVELHGTATPMERLMEHLWGDHVPASATVPEALEAIAERPWRPMGLPLPVLNSGVISGVVLPHDLISAGIELARNPESRAAPLHGVLPRAQADAALEHAIAAHRPTPLAGAPDDVCVLDMRDFASYNAACGYELGDLLLSELCELIRTIVARGEHATIFGHLGDDRFLVAAPAGTLLPRLLQVAGAFDRVLERYCVDPIEPIPAGEGGALRIALRMVYLPAALSQASSTRELHRSIENLRRSSRDHEDAFMLSSVRALMISEANMRERKAA